MTIYINSMLSIGFLSIHQHWSPIRIITLTPMPLSQTKFSLNVPEPRSNATRFILFIDTSTTYRNHQDFPLPQPRIPVAALVAHDMPDTAQPADQNLTPDMDSGQNWAMALKAPAAKVVAGCMLYTAAGPAKVVGANEGCADRVPVGLQMAGIAGAVGRR